MPQSLHDTLPVLEEGLQLLIEQDWQQEVLSQLPADYEAQARLTKAFVRARALRSAGDLLRGLLAYLSPTETLFYHASSRITRRIGVFDMGKERVIRELRLDSIDGRRLYS